MKLFLVSSAKALYRKKINTPTLPQSYSDRIKHPLSNIRDRRCSDFSSLLFARSSSGTGAHPIIIADGDAVVTLIFWFVIFHHAIRPQIHLGGWPPEPAIRFRPCEFKGEQGHVDTQKTRAKISREEGQPGSSRGSAEVAVTSFARKICMGPEVPATSPAAAVHGQLPRVQ